MIKVRIAHDFGFYGTNIWVFDEVSKDAVDLWLPVRPELKRIEFPNGEEVEPTFRFSGPQGNEFLNSLSEALISSGFRDPTVSKDGEIRRLETHLEDMRKIVFDHTFPREE